MLAQARSLFFCVFWYLFEIYRFANSTNKLIKTKNKGSNGSQRIGSIRYVEEGSYGYFCNVLFESMDSIADIDEKVYIIHMIIVNLLILIYYFMIML